jgi:hypothetical protein
MQCPSLEEFPAVGSARHPVVVDIDATHAARHAAVCIA